MLTESDRPRRGCAPGAAVSLEAAACLVAVLVAAAWFLREEALLAGARGFPLDDSWIHLQFARNLATGHGFSFNPGEPISASTAPLWTVLLAALHLLPWQPVWTAKLLGLGLLWLTALVTARLARAVGLSGGWPLLAALSVALAPSMVWGGLSGMEVPLYALLGTTGVWLHLSSRDVRMPWPATLALALSVLARPECLLLFPLALLDRWRSAGWSAAALRRNGPRIALYAGILLPGIAFSLATLGRPFPNTYYAKVGPYGLLGAVADLDGIRVGKALVLYPVQQAQELVTFLAEQNLFLAWAVPLGLLWMLRPGPEGRQTPWIVPLALLSYPVLRGMLAPFKGAGFQHGRYAAHLLPLVSVAGLVGLRLAFRILSEGLPAIDRGRLRRWGTSATWATVLTSLLALDLREARLYGWNVQNINAMHVATGTWLATNTPTGSVIATHDIGAIGYFSGRRVLDTTGLVTPQVLDFLQPGQPADPGVFRFLEREKPDYVAIVPGWYPRLPTGPPHLFAIHYETLAHNTICAGDRLVVYRAVWEPDASEGPGLTR